MNNLQVFNNPEFGEIRTITEEDRTLFCGKDVATALGYNEPHKAIARHCKGGMKRPIGVETGKKLDGTPAMQQIEMLFIPEGDVYRLAARSELPGAEKFESWIFDEVIPSIRRTGGYISGQEEMDPDDLMAKAVLVAQRTLAARAARIKAQAVEISSLTVDKQIMKPKADYFDELVNRNLLTNFRETAKQLGVKERDFIRFLLEKKYIYRDKRGKLMPYADKNNGLLEVKECYNEKTQWSGTQTMVTPKGRETFRLLHIGAYGG